MSGKFNGLESGDLNLKVNVNDPTTDGTILGANVNAEFNKVR